jgi:hypothetical protein
MKRTIDHRPVKPGKFGRLPTKKPCVDCPLARTATPGALGGYTVQQYVDVLYSFADIACHLSPGFPNNLPEQRSCTGVAMFRANLGIPASGQAAKAVRHVGANREAAFASLEEFTAHHHPALDDEAAAILSASDAEIEAMARERGIDPNSEAAKIIGFIEAHLGKT